MPTSDPTAVSEARASGWGRNWRSAIAFPLLILLIVTGFYWKLTLTNQYDWITGSDVSQQVLPWFEEEARQIQHHSFPLWDPHNWLGGPLLGEAQPGAAYPLNWLLFLIPESHGHIRIMALQWYFVAIHFMAALFCYLLCRDLGCSRTAALVGGLIFSLAGYVGTTDWPQMVNGAVWAPLVLLFLLRSLWRSNSGLEALANAALSGACLGIAWLSGHHQVPIFLALMACGIWLYYILRGGRIHWTVLRLAAVMMLTMLLVACLQVLPAIEYGHLAQRWVSAEHPIGWSEPVPYSVHQEFSLGPLSLFAIFVPGMNRHADPFIGVVAFGLALLAIALCWKSPAVRLFAAIAIGGLVYALGKNSVFQGLLYALIPMVEKARVPSMAVIIFNLGAAVLAAFGVQQFAWDGNSAWGRRIANGMLVFGLLIYTVLLGVLFLKNFHWETDDRVGITALVALLLAALLYAWRTANLSTPQASVLLIMLLLLELGNNSGYGLVSRSDENHRVDLNKIVSNGDLAEYLSQQPGPFRIETNTNALSLNWGQYHNLDVVQALGASATDNVLSNTEWHTWQARYLFGVRYTLAEKPTFADSQEVFTGASGIKIYMNPSAFPRAWGVHEILPIKSRGEGTALIGTRLEELKVKAFSMEQIPKLAQCGTPDEISIAKYRPSEVTIQAKMACDGMVVLSDTFFPGWGATVDGKPARIYEVDGALRGVLAPQGAHQVTMKYRPKTVYVGAALTLAGLAGAVGLAIASRRRESHV